MLTFKVDVTNPEESEKVVADVVRHFGRLDILVNNAGTAVAKPFEQIDDR